MIIQPKYNYSCPDTWNLIQSGKTVGVFQCESRLVRSWLKKVKPKNIWELAAVISIVRPAALMSGQAASYVKNKHSPEQMELFNNPIVDSILIETNGVIVYQEEIMLIGKNLAWQHFPENECLILVDVLRKSIGKKDSKKILEIGGKFMEGCLHNGVSQDLADKLFDVIKKSGRYAFNASHAIAYAYTAYHTAYLKTHHPKEFFATVANYSNESIDPSEYLDDILQDAKAFGMNILPPNINIGNADFQIEGENNIRFGLRFIKSTGQNLIEYLAGAPKQIKKWQDVMRLAFYKVSKDSPTVLRKNVVESLINCGAFSDVGFPRQQLLQIYETLTVISVAERAYALTQIDSIEPKALPDLILKISQEVSTKKRQQIVESESMFLRSNLKMSDSPEWIEETETKYMGCPISPTASMPYEYLSTMNCYEANQLAEEEDVKRIMVVGRLNDLYVKETRSGKNKGKLMAHFSIRDSTGRLDGLTIFSDTFSKYSDQIMDKTLVKIIMGHPANRGFFVNSVELLNAES